MDNNKENLTFEEALKRLEIIVTALEDGEMPLDRSLQAFEEGIGLVKICEAKLKDAEQKVSILVKQENGYDEQTFGSDKA